VPVTRTVRTTTFVLCLAFVASIASAKSQFAGKWVTPKASKVTEQHSITVDIVETQGTLSGTVILVNPDRTEVRLPILNPAITGTSLEFETRNGSDSIAWRLTLKGKNRAFLHGSIGEMLIDERMVKAK